MTNAVCRKADGEDPDSQSGSIGAYRCVEQSAKIELFKSSMNFMESLILAQD
jgi:hypothetical protein